MQQPDYPTELLSLWQRLTAGYPAPCWEEVGHRARAIAALNGAAISVFGSAE